MSTMRIHTCGVRTLKYPSVVAGQERDVIFVSAVRSRDAAKITDDVRHDLGFVNSPQRLDVSISRARKLLVVVDNITLLSRDANWRKLIDIARDHRCLVMNQP